MVRLRRNYDLQLGETGTVTLSESQSVSLSTVTVQSLRVSLAGSLVSPLSVSFKFDSFPFLWPEEVLPPELMSSDS